MFVNVPLNVWLTVLQTTLLWVASKAKVNRVVLWGHGYNSKAFLLWNRVPHIVLKCHGECWASCTWRWSHRYSAVGPGGCGEFLSPSVPEVRWLWSHIPVPWRCHYSVSWVRGYAWEERSDILSVRQSLAPKPVVSWSVPWDYACLLAPLDCRQRGVLLRPSLLQPFMASCQRCSRVSDGPNFSGC